MKCFDKAAYQGCLEQHSYFLIKDSSEDLPHFLIKRNDSSVYYASDKTHNQVTSIKPEWLTSIAKYSSVDSLTEDLEKRIPISRFDQVIAKVVNFFESDKGIIATAATALVLGLAVTTRRI